MDNGNTLLDTAILIGYCTIIGIALMVATLWIFKLKTEIRGLKKQLSFFTTKHKNSYDFDDKKHNRGSQS